MIDMDIALDLRPIRKTVLQVGTFTLDELEKMIRHHLEELRAKPLPELPASAVGTVIAHLNQKAAYVQVLADIETLRGAYDKIRRAA
jgi:hypothetical protein